MNELNRKRNQHVFIFLRAMLTGFIGGVIFSFISLLLEYFSISTLKPSIILLQPWLNQDWTGNWQGELIATIMFSLLSVIVAIIYFVLLRKRRSMWVGVLYGIGLWIICYLLIFPLLEQSMTLSGQSMDHIVSSIVLFISYGLFIGFSISYDYMDALCD